MLFGLRTGLVIIQNNQRSLFRMFLGVFPTLHGRAHKASHLVDECRVIQIVLKDVQTVFQRCHALVFVFERNQLVFFHARINDLPIFIVRHCRDTRRLPLQDWINIESLLENGNTTIGAICWNVKLAHPA